ncbi:hypothetical protein WR164_13870 [Philodulcilactobacillus myokoensis]|uniref:Uncharacterized protein n=1 Tax=Philodulcilactobacillus myokoensis TaxID=2929573 RepID=A0A9W6ETR2_9LACO|nr:hypothetical protein [Philodulcilactobacillus myokoensis]GLB47408.1 hypothetical protein WR164_13870 [Philodulcilactobacillus myokoensis]
MNHDIFINKKLFSEDKLDANHTVCLAYLNNSMKFNPQYDKNNKRYVVCGIKEMSKILNLNRNEVSFLYHDLKN